jgi:hypothetical protein
MYLQVSTAYRKGLGRRSEAQGKPLQETLFFDDVYIVEPGQLRQRWRLQQPTVLDACLNVAEIWLFQKGLFLDAQTLARAQELELFYLRSI